MDEMYRMLGREHEADLEREARKWERAAEVRGQRLALVGGRRRMRLRFVPARLAALLVHGVRAEG
jgi:hypothetical protein